VQPLTEPGQSARTVSRPVQDSDFAIEASGLARQFGQVKALSGVSLEIRRGEFFSLLGPSGCGKTTLLRIIAGLERPDAGTLKICGRDAAGFPAHRRPVNTVFQSYALFPHMCVFDNVAFGLRMKKVQSAEVAESVSRVLALVEISGLAQRLPAELSGGQKQRVALARAIVNEPAVLLLDEPLGALDLRLRKQLQLELRQLQRRLGITFVYVTHDQEEALTVSDRVAVMNAGRIEQVDRAEDLYRRPRTRFAAEFLGKCNLIPAKVCQVGAEGTRVMTPIGELRLASDHAERGFICDERLALAIRPENIRLGRSANPCSGDVIRARIDRLTRRGPLTEYTLAVNGLVLNAVALNTPFGERVFQEGDEAICEFPEEALVVLDDAAKGVQPDG